jgi:sugar-specific transcriptional regulator TrmB
MQREFFQSVGLTEYEISTYLTLVSKGTSDARTISHEAHVPFGKIYDTLYSLQKRGMVNVQYSRPKKFMAVNPKTVMKSIVDAKEKDKQAFIKKAAQIENDLLGIYKTKAEKSMFWSVVVGDDERLSFFKNLIKEAERDVSIYLNIDTMQNLFTKHDEDNLLEILKKEYESVPSPTDERIRIRILIGTSSNPANMLKMVYESGIKPVKNHEFRITSLLAGSFMLMDDEKVLLDLRNPAESWEHLASIYIWDKNLGTVLTKYFEKIWSTGSELNPGNG